MQDLSLYVFRNRTSDRVSLTRHLVALDLTVHFSFSGPVVELDEVGDDESSIAEESDISSRLSSALDGLDDRPTSQADADRPPSQPATEVKDQGAEEETGPTEGETGVTKEESGESVKAEGEKKEQKLTVYCA